MKKQQSGFTLIELIMVIVILGILSAFALPKFADLGGDARTSSIKGAVGALKSGASIAHAAWLAQGSTGAVTLEGTAYTLTATGYPESTDMAAIAGLSSSDYGLDTATANELKVSLTVSDGDGDGTSGECYAIYPESGAVTLTTDDC